MWLWQVEWHVVGFRRQTRRLWLCKRRFGLPPNAHLSAFVDCESTLPHRGTLIGLSTFHVTFEIASDNVHFYYHERLENEWEPGGHTSAGEITHLGADLRELRRIAAAVVEALRGVYHGREG